MSMKHIKILTVIFTILLTAFVLFCEAKNSDSSPDPGMQSGNESEAEAEAEAPDTTEALTDALMDQADLVIQTSNDTNAQTEQDVLTLPSTGLTIYPDELPGFDLSGAWTDEAGKQAIVNTLEEGGALYITSALSRTLEEECAGRCQTYEDEGISYTVSDTVASSSASALAINAAASNSYWITTILVATTGDAPYLMEFSIDRLADNDSSIYTAVSDYIRTAFQLDMPVAEDIDISTDSDTLQPSTGGERDEPIIIR